MHVELPMRVKVDLAHLVMLAERRLVARERAVAVLRFLETLASGDLDAADYEAYLAERLGPEAAGLLETGRARDDLDATLTSLRSRAWLLGFAEKAIRLEAILLARARAYEPVILPGHTRFRAAAPITYGYYLLGVARAVGREIDALVAAAGGLHTCPLGACAGAGTDLPIDPSRTAGLLGYLDAGRHALDAVASRDAVLRMLGAAAGLTVVLSRLAADLQAWSAAESNFISFPDRPRSTFPLEHLKAKPARLAGAWAGAVSAMAAAPFAGTAEVGAEAMENVWPGLAAAEQAVELAQTLAGGARPDAAADAKAPEAVGEHSYGGGPGAFAEPYQRAYASWVRHRRWCADWREAQAEADAALEAAVKSVLEQP
ncbi:lyase family protein [Nonomuraea typhae]|uniref:argininosuccinate lyase n=1 Tax=Nonomuraea typhae TaxID=2603600 RepID=A0ABW7YZV8_9ACTN